MTKANAIYLFIAILIITGIIFYLESRKINFMFNSEITPVVVQTESQKNKKYEFAKEITAPAGFINTDGIKIADLIGKKVILLDIWTYSCINCQRTLPYITAWYDKYKDQGLEVIGIHTPEFEFEKKLENVQLAVDKFGIKYPVVLDNDYGTWSAYHNRYWPRKYLIDIDGYIVYDHIGEGGYEETEHKIQELLQERKERLGEAAVIDKQITKVVEAETSEAQSPEIYFGSARNLYLGNGKEQKRGLQSLSEPFGVKTNILYLAGDWNFQPEYAENQTAQAKIIFRYKGSKVFLVAEADKIIRGKILLDGQPVTNLAGEDVVNGYVNFQTSRLYKLINDTQGPSEHTLEIIIEEPALRAFAFTFG